MYFHTVINFTEKIRAQNYKIICEYNVILQYGLFCRRQTDKQRITISPSLTVIDYGNKRDKYNKS